MTANAGCVLQYANRCGTADYYMTLTKVRLILDSDYGDRTFARRRRVTRQWADVPEVEYYLTFSTADTNPTAA